MINGGKRETRNREQSGRSAIADAQETRPVVDKRIDVKTKTICTQTSMEAVQSNEKNLHDEAATDANHFGVYLKQKQSSVFCIDEDPAPQWLIEEALARGTEVCKECVTIISELEAKLSRTKEDLEDALKAKFIVKEKYKRLLENARTEARKESEVLQENIVRICTSVLENFGPRSMDRKKTACYQIKSHGKLKCHQRITNKLRRKQQTPLHLLPFNQLQTAVTKSNKLKRRLATTRKKLRNKSEEYESISKCFDQLKQEMEATETNLNGLISENLSLKRKIDDTRDWLKHTVGKQHHTGHFRDACKSRELTNLKKKVEEDSATIVQLRNKLVRLESANANKGFLLNSYKAQLADLTKEKNQLLSKVNGLENEISNTRNSNSQLRAKILVLSNEKDRLLSDNEKSKADTKEKMEMQYAKRCEEAVQLEIETIKNKYEETIKFMKTKLLATETQNVEYLNAIKEFLKKLYKQRNDDREAQKSNESEAGEKETHEAICNILNMTPDELSGFINGKTKNSINPWIIELNRIISTSQFSSDLSKFLLRKMKKIKM
ncbi:major antigen-like isoform X2 [Frieseomelitta varia]|uniref:major antigen-like isoform X2 n=1 Tax=Frieseomelitta varia TaxID=561572 RepID=UPI001CB6B000|nr:major antigen-like isoform X2 [Frieseomelitta varia]